MRKAEGHADAPAYTNPPPPLPEPSDRDREWHARRYDALAGGTGRDPPRDGGARYAPAHPASAREPLGAPTRVSARSSSREREAFAFDRGGGARGGAASARDPFAFDREGPPGSRLEGRLGRSAQTRWSPAPVAPEAPPREDPPERARREPPASDARDCELVLYGYPADATHLDVRRSVESVGFPLARVHAFTDRLYVCPTYSVIRDVPDAKCVAAYARARTAAEAKKVLDEVNGGADGGPRLCRDAPLAAMRWDAPRPGVLQGIPRAPPPEVRVEVTRRYIGERERASAPPPPARALGNDRRAEETPRASRRREPLADSSRATAGGRSRDPEWLGPNRCAVHACGQMGRLIGPNGTCVIGMKKETGCEISKLDDESVVVEGATQTLVARGVERVRDEVSKWLRAGAGARDAPADDLVRATKAQVAPKTTKHPIVPWRPNPAAALAAREGLESQKVTKIGGAPTPASGERPRSADAPSAPVSAEREMSENGEIVPEPRAIGSPTSAENALVGLPNARDEAADETLNAEPEEEIGAGLGYDAVADFSDCLPPGRASAGGGRQSERAAGDPEPEPEPDAPPGEPDHVSDAGDAQPPPPPPPPAPAASAEDEAEAPAPPEKKTEGSRDERSPRERVLSLVAARQITRDTLVRRIEDALDPTRAPETDPALRMSPEAEVCLESRNLFVRHRVSARRAASRYRVSRVLSATPDASAREKTRAKPEGWTLARDWALALDERDDERDEKHTTMTMAAVSSSPAMPTRGAEEGALRDNSAAPRRGSSETRAFVSGLSNVACEPAEVDAWVARRFGGAYEKAAASIRAMAVSETARKRPAPARTAPLSDAPPAKKKRGGGA